MYVCMYVCMCVCMCVLCVCIAYIFMYMQEKKSGKGNDVARQREELNALGLRIKVIQGDGNCLFRAIADQVIGFKI